MSSNPDEFELLESNEYFLRSKLPHRKRKRYNLDPFLISNEELKSKSDCSTSDKNSICPSEESDDSEPKIIVPQGNLYFRCQMCSALFINRADLDVHIKNFHEKQNKKRKIRNPPDPEDPNNYCCACDFVYKNRASYCSHLRNVHSMRGLTAALTGNHRTTKPHRSHCNGQQSQRKTNRVLYFHQRPYANSFEQERGHTRSYPSERSESLAFSNASTYALSLTALAFMAFILTRKVFK